MNILIVGAGAIGSLIGARLSTTHASVVLFSTDRAHMEAVRTGGLKVEELDGTVRHFALNACFEVDKLPPNPDLVLILVKSHATRQALSLVQGLFAPSTVFLTLQNGIGNWEQISKIVGKRSVLAGTTAQGSTLLAPGMIRHGGNGPTYIGEPDAPISERVRNLVELFAKAGLVTEPGDQMQRLIWQKLIVNVGINAITAITGIRNGSVAELEEAAALCKAAVSEACVVAGLKGFPMGADSVDRVLSVARATALNRSSMGQDVDRKKRTEIEAINGAIVRFGKQVGAPTPVNETLTSLVKVLQAHYTGK
ncbi:MAG: ketopantoate reductase family protein [Syntrophobacteraceae bacterium]|nr:ketopantoate reductase family protein [Syntrophobacteraceae bacterium]